MNANTTALTVRQAMKQARLDRRCDALGYRRERWATTYQLVNDETLEINTARDFNGDILLGVFVAVRYDRDGLPVARYSI